MKKRYILFILIVLFGVTFWFFFKHANAPVAHDTADNGLTPEAAPARKDDLIIVDTPLPRSSVVSPLVVKGRARGNWYFEASFPVVLTDASGAVIAQGHADAQGDWMTTEYVPFTASLTFTAPPSGSTGYLILKKDNPSGDPTKDDSLSLPVTF